MSTQTLRIVRNVLLRSFLISLVIALAMAGATRLGWDTWVHLFTVRWRLMDSQMLTLITVGWFSLIRLVLVFGMLVPGLACHWTLKAEGGTAGR